MRLLSISAILICVLAHERHPAVGGPSDGAPLGYKNPLDVTVDEKGLVAQVQLSGRPAVAVVDLLTGIVKETRVNDRPLPAREDRSLHVPEGLRAKAAGLQLPGVSNIRGVCADADETFLLLAHQSPKMNIPATQVAQGWVFVNAVTRYRLKRVNEGAWLLPQRHTAVLDQPNRACADPSDVVLAPGGRTAFVACAGADKVLVLDLDRLHDLVERFGRQTGHSYPPHLQLEDLTVRRDYVVAELPVERNPRRLNLSGDGKTLVVSNYLSGSLTVIDAVKHKVVKHISLGGPKPDAVRRGEILFNSAKLTFQGQFSCASCHPNGGADGLNWDLSRDGIGNFKNTKSLLGLNDTAPYGWLGTSPTLEDRIRGTLRTLHRHEPNEELGELADLAAYLRSLPVPAQADRLAVGSDEEVARGKAIFEGKGRCSACHGGPAFDDGKLHDVGTVESSDASRDRETAENRLNTPSLRGLARTAPYLHDGSAATLEEVLSKRNAKHRHGDAHELSPEELNDLIAYLRSL